MTVSFRLAEEVALVIQTVSERRGISATEGLRQIVALGLPNWRARGAPARAKAHRRSHKAFLRSLRPGEPITMPDGRIAILRATVGRHGAWEADPVDGGCPCVIPKNLIKPPTTE